MQSFKIRWGLCIGHFRLNLQFPLEQLFWIGFLLTEIFKKSKGLSLKFLGAFYKTITQKRARDLFFWCFLFFFLPKIKFPFPVFPKQKQKREGNCFCFDGPYLEPNPTFSKFWGSLAQTSKALSKAVLGLSDLSLRLCIHFTIILLNHKAFCSPKMLA